MQFPGFYFSIAKHELSVGDKRVMKISAQDYCYWSADTKSI